MNGASMSFGETVRLLRQKAGLTQLDLAQKAGLSLRSVQNWEQDHRIPRLATLLALANALGVSVEGLLAEENAHSLQTKRHGKSRR
jgi:transcriptional regulator with XRE-family HTH domain